MCEIAITEIHNVMGSYVQMALANPITTMTNLRLADTLRRRRPLAAAYQFLLTAPMRAEKKIIIFLS